jgi:nucleoside-diphosphate-sugar epimerase
MRVAITGANGFVGQALLKRLSDGGCRLIALTRNPLSGPAGHPCEWLRYTLEDGLSDRLPEDCDSVIHCAYSMSARGAADLELNVNAFRALQASAAGRRLVFISSMSAHAGAQSTYGRGKWAIEGMLRSDADLAIKPGFVIGSGGIFGRLRRSIRALPFVPLFYGGRQPIQPIWVGDLAEAVARAVERRLTGALALGSVEAMALRDFYRAILASEYLRRPLVPVPGGLSLAMLRVLESLGIELPVTSENLLGLKALRRFDTKTSLELLELRPVDLAEALRRTNALEHPI